MNRMMSKIKYTFKLFAVVICVLSDYIHVSLIYYELIIFMSYYTFKYP